MRCAEGLCPLPAAEGRLRCASHLEARRRIAEGWRRRQAESGLCVSCMTPAQPGFKKCGKHRVQHRRYVDGAHASRVRSRYGVDYAATLADQDGVCAICRLPETTTGGSGQIKRLAVDHNHDTGEVRGLLCNNCNRAIGFLRDDPALVRRAADYLEGLLK